MRFIVCPAVSECIAILYIGLLFFFLIGVKSQFAHHFPQNEFSYLSELQPEKESEIEREISRHLPEYLFIKVSIPGLP